MTDVPGTARHGNQRRRAEESELAGESREMSAMGMMIASAASRVGLNPRETKRFIKFAVVGTIGAVVDFGTYNILLGPFGRAAFVPSIIDSVAPSVTLSPEQVVATSAGTISFILAIISNFIWNRYWTYPDSRSKSVRRQFVQFFLVNVTAILVRLPILTLTVNFFTRTTTQMLPALGEPLALRLGKNLALALAVGIAMFWNFFVNRYWTYGDVE